MRPLIDAFVSAYEPYLRGRLGELGLEPPPGWDEAVSEGRRWLAASLEELLARPFAEQRRGPLEVFQEAMRFPTNVLAAEGVERAGRNPVAQNALPGDEYDLAPASSRLLGDEAWRAHLTWGATKAEQLRDRVEEGNT